VAAHFEAFLPQDARQYSGYASIGISPHVASRLPLHFNIALASSYSRLIITVTLARFLGV
jgi:hypothetical protein